MTEQLKVFARRHEKELTEAYAPDGYHIEGGYDIANRRIRLDIYRSGKGGHQPVATARLLDWKHEGRDVWELTAPGVADVVNFHFFGAMEGLSSLARQHNKL